jgi:transposase
VEAREQRGLEIAATKKLRRRGDLWLVPSQLGSGTYVVDPKAPDCTCPDFEERQLRCKHVFAVEYTLRRETTVNGQRVTQTLRMTYAQDWPAYNAAQVHEKDEIAKLLHNLCAAIDPPVQKRGRPRLPLSTAVFCATMKVYCSMSARRTMSDLRDLAAKGYLPAVPHFNSVLGALENPGLAPLLQMLITEAARPLRGLETDFATDSSGFGTKTDRRWFSEKYGKEKSVAVWIRGHALVGTKTNVVTAVEVTETAAHDSKFLEPLLYATLRAGFNVERLSADKAYSSREVLSLIHDAGALPLIPFKLNATGRTPGPGLDVWEKMYHFFTYHRDEFLPLYHRRSNVESSFHMVKSKFGAAVRSKTTPAQLNEVLCKVLCHNLCCLVQAMYELGVEPEFWKAA